MKRRNLLVAGVAGLGLGTIGAAPAHAAGGTIKFIYPYSPGEAGDTLLRVISDDVGRKLGRNAVVENHTGADGRIGVRDVKLADPDGNTVLFTPFGLMTPSRISPRSPRRRPSISAWRWGRPCRRRLWASWRHGCARIPMTALSRCPGWARCRIFCR